MATIDTKVPLDYTEKDLKVEEFNTAELERLFDELEFKNIEILNLEGCMDPLALNYKSYFIKSKPSDCTFKKKRK